MQTHASNLRRRSGLQRQLVRPLLTQGLLLAGIALSFPVMAHDEPEGPNGGPVAEVSGHHVELVGTGLQLAFFLNEKSGGAEPVKAVSGLAMALQGSTTAMIALSPQSPNKLSGELPHPLGVGDRVLVMATLADDHFIQARFVRN